jgi:HD-GYP domain-containing protein (c-di-GMP phosphodiesterase class II)
MMPDLRRTARLFLISLGVVAAALLVVGLAAGNMPTGERVALAVAFTGLMTLTYMFPLHFAYKTKLALDTSVTFAAVLLFEPGVAMLISGIGTALAHLIRRQPAAQLTFNSAQSMLQAALGGWLLVAVDWRYGDLDFGHPQALIAILGAATSVYLVNCLAVATIVALQTGMSLWLHWRQSLSFGITEESSLFALGLLAAIVVDVHAWALPLLVLPGFVVHLSLERNIGLRQQTLDAVQSLADIVDLRDPYTADHSRRVAVYARSLAMALDLSPDDVDLIEQAARVHDIGKLLVDREVLTKEGKLSDADWEQLKRHPVTGAEILGRFPQFVLATSFVRHHHEAIDGRGYPDGIAGDEIPFGARIIAVADSLDAMASARPYRPALPLEVVLGEFSRKRGTQWDALVVDTLLRLVDEHVIELPGTGSEREIYDRFGQPISAPAVA